MHPAAILAWSLKSHIDVYSTCNVCNVCMTTIVYTAVPTDHDSSNNVLAIDSLLSNMLAIPEIHSFVFINFLNFTRKVTHKTLHCICT